MNPSRDTTLIRPPVAVFAIVVIYRCLPMESPSLRTLLESSMATAGSNIRLRVRVADNTPGGQVFTDLPAEVDYQAYPDNPGLAKPYNDALAFAAQEGFDWLLTLDQDTHLPSGFLTTMTAVAATYVKDETVAAVVPKIEDLGRLISPFCFKYGFLPIVLPSTTRGLTPPHASALNSASLLRVRSLEELGGYDLSFPLHNSDTRLYQRLDKAGKRIIIADMVVPHELSILQREERMSPERYTQMLWDECRFWDSHMGLLGRVERTVRLLGRYVKGVFRKENPAFQHITLMEIWRRLLTGRRARLADWESKLPQARSAPTDRA